ncbi:MAG: FAD-binding protein [candidate division WOR-3 bacterium]|nr:MAG: FAD-binding protein [candidate division WOR-3 bacterium]
MKFHPVTAPIIESLKKILEPSRVIVDKDTLENYAHDETPLYHTLPEVVVKPVSTDEVSRIMELAHEHVIPVTPRCGGTSLSGGAVPLRGGIVLSLELMDRIKEIDEKNFMAVVEPGVITEQFDKELARHGLFFPPDPVSSDSCMIGGNVAECAGGPRAMKYGVTKNYVVGIEVVLADGTVQKYGGKLLKNVTGYDIIDLIVGSEGTLAVITEVTVRVLSRPRYIVALLIPFMSIEDASEFTLQVLRQGISPAAIEFMDGEAYRLVQKYLGRTLPHYEAGTHIIVELDGDEHERIRQQYDTTGEIALRCGALDVYVGETSKDKIRIWEARKKMSDALKAETSPIAREDLVVPKDKIPRLITRLKTHVQSYDACLYAFGHLGDGNIHADIAARKHEHPDQATIMKLRKEIYEITVSLGGTITAEHGVGLSKIGFLSLAVSSEQIELMKRIKMAFDKKGILNPGKIFPGGDRT